MDRERIVQLFFFGFLAVMAYELYELLLPFLTPLAWGMLLAFVAGLSQALLRGIDLRCGCFGGDEAANWWTVLRDLAMLVPALVVLFTPAPGPAREDVELPAHLGRMSTKY